MQQKEEEKLKKSRKLKFLREGSHCHCNSPTTESRYAIKYLLEKCTLDIFGKIFGNFFGIFILEFSSEYFPYHKIKDKERKVRRFLLFAQGLMVSHFAISFRATFRFRKYVKEQRPNYFRNKASSYLPDVVFEFKNIDVNENKFNSDIS